MKDLPFETRETLITATKQMERTPFVGAWAISDYLRCRFSYGADENLEQGLWMRYPHQVQKMMNCNDAGIYGFLLSRQLGLDSSLLRIENYRNTGQSHMEVMVRGSRHDYFVARDSAQRGRLRKGELEFEGNEGKWYKEPCGAVQFLDLSDVVRMIEQSKQPGGAAQFVRTGQLMKQLNGVTAGLHIPFRYWKSLMFSGDSLLQRNSFELPGLVLHHEIEDEYTRIKISEGMDNVKLNGVLPIYTINSQSGRIFKYVLQNPEKAKRVRRAVELVMIGSLRTELYRIGNQASYIQLGADYELDPVKRDVDIRFKLIRDLAQRKKSKGYRVTANFFRKQSPCTFEFTAVLHEDLDSYINTLPLPKQQETLIEKFKETLKKEGISKAA